jgi:hypothetical protein
MSGEDPVLPRRDSNGRAVSLPQLTAAAVAGLVVAFAALVGIDWVLSLMGLSDFGDASGWLALILPALLFFDEIRAWDGHGVRFLVAAVGAAVAIGLGLIAAALANSWPATLSGVVGALVAALFYSAIWFLGIRWLTGASGSAGAR